MISGDVMEIYCVLTVLDTVLIKHFYIIHSSLIQCCYFSHFKMMELRLNYVSAIPLIISGSARIWTQIWCMSVCFSPSALQPNSGDQWPWTWNWGKARAWCSVSSLFLSSIFFLHVFLLLVESYEHNRLHCHGAAKDPTFIRYLQQAR